MTLRSTSQTPIPNELWEQAWAVINLDPPRAESLARQDPNHPYARLIQAYLHWRNGHPGMAQDLLLPLLDDLKLQKPTVWYCRALSTSGAVASVLNQGAQAMLWLEEQLQIARTLGDSYLEASGLHDLALLFRHIHPTRAKQYHHQALALFNTLDVPLTLPLTYLALGELEQDAEQYEAALAYYDQALRCPDAILQPLVEAVILYSIVDVLHLLGRPKEGTVAEARLRVLRETSDHPEIQVVAWLSLSRRDAPAEVIAHLSGLPGLLDDQENHTCIPLIYERLSVAYEQLELYAEALAASKTCRQYERVAQRLHRQYVAQAFESLLTLEATQRDMALLQQQATHLEQLNQHITHLSHTDALTGLANRLALFKQAEQWLAEERPISVALFDIDSFKQINDTWGHATGDLVLIQVAHALQAHAEPGDLVARYGGEEFIVVRPGTEPLRPTCEAMLEAVRQLHVAPLPVDRPVTLSAGVTSPGRVFQPLLEEADQKLYCVKRNGKNAVSG